MKSSSSPAVTSAMPATPPPTSTAPKEGEENASDALNILDSLSTQPMINPHIPEYISKTPWYLPDTNSLSHQRAKKRPYATLSQSIEASAQAYDYTRGSAATKYRKGACENCGAMTHTKKTCLERPRRRGAKLTGRAIAADEREVQEVDGLGFEGKRDRWNGYDEREFVKVQQRYAKVDEERKKVKAAKLDSDLRAGNAPNEDSSDEEEAEGGGKEVGTSRNLRLREDTAKYLHNLDDNSAFYDPKSRSMRADPNPKVATSDKTFAGDNFVRFTGDVQKMQEMELHYLKVREGGHLQAEPTRAELLYRAMKEREEEKGEGRRRKILEKYGGAEDGEVGGGVENVYREYDGDGRVLGSVKAVVSRYEEDVLESGHAKVWGSLWKEGKWGYACCGVVERFARCEADQ